MDKNRQKQAELEEEKWTEMDRNQVTDIRNGNRHKQKGAEKTSKEKFAVDGTTNVMTP